MDNLETLLKEKGITKTAFSDMLGIKKQNLNGLMKNPTLTTLRRFADVLGVPVWKLFVSDIEDHEPTNKVDAICPHCGKPIKITVE